jgi:hypothetical protein
MSYSLKHKQDTRERIVNSARRLFNRKGFTEVTIDEIGDEIVNHQNLAHAGNRFRSGVIDLRDLAAEHRANSECGELDSRWQHIDDERRIS